MFLKTTKGTLHSIDYSNAVEANFKNNFKFKDRLKLSQASIYEMLLPITHLIKFFVLVFYNIPLL